MAQRWLSIERVCLAAVVAITLWQVLVSPYVGLADNSDFGKVAGRFSLRPPAGVFEDHFVYVVGKYVYDPKIYWNSGILSSEVVPVWLAVAAHRVFGGDTAFDIRYLGVMHALVAGLALWLAFPALRKLDVPARVVTCTLLAVTLIDPSWVSYWNSFYMDAASLVFLLLVAGTGVRMIAAPSTLNRCLFGCAVLLLITSKLQHAVPALVFCVYLALLRRWTFAAAGVALTIVLALTNPPFYHQKAIFNLVFFEFAPRAPDPQKALAEFGMQPGDTIALGMHAFENKYPANDPGWCDAFEKRARFTPVLSYYVHHPSEVARHLRTVLADNLHEVRASNLGNFRREDHVPPGTLSRQWNWWSAAQEWAYGKVPYAIVVIYATAIAVTVALRRRSTAPADLMLAFVTFGLAEFFIATLGDVLDTGRHLRLFHATTDLLVVAMAACLSQTGCAHLAAHRPLARANVSSTPQGRRAF